MNQSMSMDPADVLNPADDGRTYAVKHTNRGELYRYPMTIRFLRAPVRVV